MRILHVIPAVAARYGGPSSSIVEMCRALEAAGIDPLIATTDADGGGRLGVELGRVVRWQGVSAVFFRRQFSEAFKYSHPLARWLHERVADFSVVHIHAVLSHASLAAAAACRSAGVPYVVRPLGTLDPWSLRQKGARKRLLLQAAAVRLLKGAAAIHYTSDEEQTGVESALGLSRGVVIPLGVDHARLERAAVDPASRDDDPYVLALSRLHPVKNLEALVDAFALALPSAPAWRLIIAGAGDPAYAAALRQASEKGSAADRITFAGWVDGGAKAGLIERASLFALPSHHENFGVSLVEALAAGVPAVVSSGVHLSAAIGRAGAGWVVGTDVESMSAGLAEAFGDALERHTRGAAARTFSARFAWPAVAGELTRLYDGIAGRGLSAPVGAVGVGA